MIPSHTWQLFQVGITMAKTDALLPSPPQHVLDAVCVRLVFHDGVGGQVKHAP